MHSLPCEGNTASSTDHRRTTKAINPIRRGIDKNGIITRKSAKRDIFLPPIHKQLAIVSLANLDTAKGWSYSTKELIANEWDNLERIKKSGSLNSKYSVLPPINHKADHINNNNTTKSNANNPNSVLNADNLKLMFRSIEMSEVPSQEHLEKSTSKDKGGQHSKRRTSKRKEIRYKSQSTAQVAEVDCGDGKRQENNSDEKDKKLPDIVPKQSTGKIFKKQQQPPQLTLPKILSPNLNKKTNGATLEKMYEKKMIEWALHQGRRNAICYEIDALFSELTSIIKYNILVQHLEDIWMC